MTITLGIRVGAMRLPGLALLMLISMPLSAGEYSEAEKCEIYFRADMPRPDAEVLSIKDPRWNALNGPLLVDKVNRIGVNKERATVLAASCIEFNYLLQPISDLTLLEERRCMIENLKKVFSKLNPSLLDLAKMEHVFTHLLEQEQNPSPNESLSHLFVQSGLITGATALSLPYIAKHFSFDWQLLASRQGNLPWLCVMVCLKIVGTASGLYKSYEMVKSNAQQILSKINKDDRFVLNFSKAMILVEQIIEIIRKNPTLANTFTIFIDFDHACELSPGLNQTLTRAKKRLLADWFCLASLWKSKDSPSLYRDIKKYTKTFKTLYYGLARLDAYLAVVRIYQDLEQRGLPVTLARYRQHETRPCFFFKDLRNPLIDDSVANDFELDGNAVLNGPSTCGKTVAIKTISYGFILGQSILLVPANKAEFAPVNNIGAYFNISDNIKEGQSSYEAQRLAIDGLLNLAQKPGRTLLFIDEPYNGITSDLGEELTDRLIKKLITFSHVTFLLSTHHRKPTEYGEKKDGVVHNWQPELLEIDNKFRRTFKMIDGIAKWWYEDREKALAFIKQISDE